MRKCVYLMVMTPNNFTPPYYLGIAYSLSDVHRCYMAKRYLGTVTGKLGILTLEELRSCFDGSEEELHAFWDKCTPPGKPKNQTEGYHLWQ